MAEATAAFVGIVLAIACFIVLVRGDDPLYFQWPATFMLVAWGVFAALRGSEGLGYLLVYLGVVWFIVQPLPNLIERMRRIESPRSSYPGARKWPRPAEPKSGG